MPAHIRWMAFWLAIVAVAVLGMAFAWTVAASAYDTVGPASTAATVDARASQDGVPASAGGGSATVGVDAVVDMLPPDGAAEPTPLQIMDGDGGWGMGSGWWIVMVVLMVLFWGGVIALVVWGINQFTGDRRRDRNALDIAKERLAGGEITNEEFDRIRSDLV